MVRKVAFAVLAGLVVALAACSKEDAELILTGPDSVNQGDIAWFDATITGATPILGFVWWTTFVDLDDDNYPDRNEVMEVTYSGIDRLGKATKVFWVQPLSYFGDRDLAVPTSATVKVRALVEVSDLTYGYFILTEGHTMLISTGD